MRKTFYLFTLIVILNQNSFAQSGYRTFDEYIDRYCYYLIETLSLDSIRIDNGNDIEVLKHKQNKPKKINKLTGDSIISTGIDTSLAHKLFNKSYSLYYLNDFKWRDSLGQLNSNVKIKTIGNRTIHIENDAHYMKKKWVFKNGNLIKVKNRKKGSLRAGCLVYPRFDSFKISYNKNGYPEKLKRSFWPMGMVASYKDILSYDNELRIVKRKQYFKKSKRLKKLKHIQIKIHITNFQYY